MSILRLHSISNITYKIKTLNDDFVCLDFIKISSGSQWYFSLHMSTTEQYKQRIVLHKRRSMSLTHEWIILWSYREIPDYEIHDSLLLSCSITLGMYFTLSLVWVIDDYKIIRTHMNVFYFTSALQAFHRGTEESLIEDFFFKKSSPNPLLRWINFCLNSFPVSFVIFSSYVFPFLA